jgi:O-antigen/teichoic acid export membrane protein
MPSTSDVPATGDSTLALFRGIAQGSSLYSIALIGQRVASLVLLPISTRFLTPVDYGISDLLEQVSVVISLLLGGSFSSSLGYFYFQEESAANRRQVVGTAVFGALVIGTLAGLVCWPFGGGIATAVFGNPSARFYLYAVFGSLGVSFLLEALCGWLRVEDRTVAFVTVSWLRVAMTIVGTVVLVALLRLHVWGVLWTSIGAISLTALALAVYCYRELRPVFDGRLFWRMLRFSLPIGFSGLGIFVIHFGDRFILPHYRPFSELGIYAITYKLGMMVSLVYGSFHTYWSARVFQIMRRPDADSVFARVFTYVMLAVSFTGLVLTIGARPALELLTAPAFHGAAALVPVIVSAYFMRSIGDFFRCLFIEQGRPEYDAACNWIGAAICLIGYFVLIPRFGMWGAAFATLATFLTIGVISVAWTYRVRPYSVETGRLAKVALAAAVPLVVYALVPLRSVPVQIAGGTAIIALFPLLLWLLRFPTAGELQAAGGLLRSLPVLGRK